MLQLCGDWVVCTASVGIQAHDSGPLRYCVRWDLLIGRQWAQMLGERNTARLCSSLQGSNGPGAETMVFCVKSWFT